jgi:hypothetical protein
LKDIDSVARIYFKNILKFYGLLFNHGNTTTMQRNNLLAKIKNWCCGMEKTETMLVEIATKSYA